MTSGISREDCASFGETSLDVFEKVGLLRPRCAPIRHSLDPESTLPVRSALSPLYGARILGPCSPTGSKAPQLLRPTSVAGSLFPCAAYASKFLTHMDPRPWPGPPAFEELANSSFVFSKLQPSLLRNWYAKAIRPGSQFLFRMAPPSGQCAFEELHL